MDEGLSVGLYRTAALVGTVLGLGAVAVHVGVSIWRVHRPEVSALVYAARLEPGRTLRSEDLRVVEVHPEVAAGAIGRIEEARGRRLTCPGVPGELVLPGCLAPAGP